MPTILKNVSKEYAQGKKVLDNVSAEIKTGEFFVIVGPSGCGKSTLLRMIAGLTEISDGTIKIEDRVVNDLPPKDRNLTMVFQSYALFPFLSVWDNVAFGLKARQNDAAKIKERVDNALKMVNLEEFSDRKPRELSGGQRQRVALARAVASDAKICLMDEPLSNLDAQLRIKMHQEIYALQRKLGLTLIYVTHDQVEAMTMADHIMVLNDSKIQQVGTPTEIYNHPANEFVASFFGVPPINLMNAKKVSENIALVNKDFEVELAQTIEEENFRIGIRPNQLQVNKADELHANATIKAVEFLGDEKIVHTEMNHGGVISVIVASEAVFDPFESIEITCDDSSKALLFDLDGNNITETQGVAYNA
ncbi:ABC transporter ATP-binding protein [Companilactobacillus versmoldensis]|nr:ABC transporter ATP-binding protein [Companilactobacillus versmoldensis]